MYTVFLVLDRAAWVAVAGILLLLVTAINSHPRDEFEDKMGMTAFVAAMSLFWLYMIILIFGLETILNIYNYERKKEHEQTGNENHSAVQVYVRQDEPGSGWEYPDR